MGTGSADAADRGVLIELGRRLDLGEELALATAISLAGDPPGDVGQRLLMGRDGAIAGTLGCAEFDGQAVAAFEAVMAGGRPAARTLRHELGTMEVLVEPFATSDRIVVLGATPIARWVIRWGADLGLGTVLVDAGRPPAPQGDRTSPTRPATDIAGDIAANIDKIGLRRSDAVVATDHDADGLADQLEAALRAGVRWLGVVGSARHVGGHVEELRRRGIPDSDLDRIETPVGLDLGGRSAPEIALSIVAGLVAFRHGRSGGRIATRGATRSAPTSPS